MNSQTWLNLLVSILSGGLAGGFVSHVSVRRTASGRDSISGNGHKVRYDNGSGNHSKIKQRVKNGDAIGRDKNTR